MAANVRYLSARDYAQWAALFRAYIAFYQADVSDAVIECTWQRLIASDTSMYGLVAVDATDTPVGFALLVFHPSTWTEGSYCYLEDLFVAPDARGRGVGRALIEATYREADARGATRTYWVTESTNSTARQLYDSLATATTYVQYRR